MSDKAKYIEENDKVIFEESNKDGLTVKAMQLGTNLPRINIKRQLENGKAKPGRVKAAELSWLIKALQAATKNVKKADDEAAKTRAAAEKAAAAEKKAKKDAKKKEAAKPSPKKKDEAKAPKKASKSKSKKAQKAKDVEAAPVQEADITDLLEEAGLGAAV